MKILSIISVGGRLIKLMGICIVVMLAFNACDSAQSILLGNNKTFYDYALSDSNRVRLRCMYFNGTYFFSFELKGEYVLNPRSLNLIANDENIRVVTSIPSQRGNNIEKNNTLVKDNSICMGIKLVRKDKTQEIKLPPVIYVLPSDFFMHNGQRVITDSLRIVLKKPEYIK